ncbi:MAG: hypothetical protein EOO90_23010 [Pedobacter sp.]|nr:MAG: hypothetical protein EOO90_23010 [Pedobacter sp.]
MPKEIKAIQCPKCGATQKEELRPEYFRCQNCDTEYFLDNEWLNNAAFRRFQNGDIYAIGNKSLLYKIDQINTRLSDMPADFFSRHGELAAGIAQIEFIGSEWGDGLKLVTNGGKSRIFFPTADKVFNEKRSYTAEKALAIKEAGAKTRTYFLFSKLSDDFPDEPIKLMMYTQKDNKGGPNTRPFFQKKDYTFFYGKKVISDFRQGADYVISYKDLTPGRSYYSPEILYYDNQYVLIMFKATAAASSNTIIQCQSVPDGKIMFSLPVGKKKSIDHTAYYYKNGCVLETYEAMYITDMKGKIIKEFKIIN